VLQGTYLEVRKNMAKFTATEFIIFGLVTSFISAHKIDRLAGLLKVWQRLRERPDANRFENHDLDWARDIMVELTKHEEGHGQMMAFQSSIFDLMMPGTAKHYAFGRNLADKYARVGQIAEAISLREQIGRGTRTHPYLYISSGPCHSISSIRKRDAERTPKDWGRVWLML
jgi:hypothetical protein